MPTYSVSLRDVDARNRRIQQLQKLIARLNAAGDGDVGPSCHPRSHPRHPRVLLSGGGDGVIDGFNNAIDAGDGIDVGDGDGVIAADFHIELARDGAYITCAALPKFSPHRVCFERARSSMNADPLRRALGGARTVIDATAGWGVDAARMAGWCRRVTAVEKHPLIAALLQHAHAQCDDAELRARLTVVHADSVDYLHAVADAPDAIYLDPMYPPSTKTAAAKKPLTILRRLAGRPGDAGELFSAAITRAARRVIIKRPPRAAPLIPGKVGQTSGKLARYDIYKPAAA